MNFSRFSAPSRRSVLKGAAAFGAALAAPVTLRAAPNFVRRNMTATDAKAKQDVKSYRAGVRAMLEAEPDHPHNWYRNGIIHLMDCPHGNWWFTVWHRGYLGYFEQIIREMSGDSEFALPYWDWSAQSYVPQDFFSDPDSDDETLRVNALDPSSDLYVSDYATFDGGPNKDAMRVMFDSFDDAQRAQLNLRMHTQDPNAPSEMTFDVFWEGWNNSVRANFGWNPSIVRRPTAAAPALTEYAAEYVKPDVIRAAIKPFPFVMIASETDPVAGFNSVVGANHHSMSGSQAVLEHQPHNQVHNNLGPQTGSDDLFGIMPSNLSSIDPLFFMHHSNVDRIWDVWTRKQIKHQKPIGPTSDQELYYNEEFLFFLKVGGAPVRDDTSAKTFMDMDRFGYEYTDGTGSELATSDLVAFNVRSGPANVNANAMFSNTAPSSAELALPEELIATVGATAGGASQVAHITFVQPEQVNGVAIDVFISPKGEAPKISKDSPELAGTISYFGMIGHKTKGHMHGSVTVTLDITAALKRLSDQGVLQPGAPLDFTLAVVAEDGSLGKALEGELKSVHVEAI